jgi:hypothetical protein
MTHEELEKKIIEAMETKIPDEATIIDRHIIYKSTRVTHDSYKIQLLNASRGTRVYRTYLIRCYEWLVLLKKEKIDLNSVIK